MWELRVPRSGSLQVLMSHLQHYHSAEHGALLLQLEQTRPM